MRFYNIHIVLSRKKIYPVRNLVYIRAEVVMTVCRRNATTRQYRLKIMTSGTDKAFVEIVEPQKFKGRQILRLGENLWVYFRERRVRRPIRVSGKQAFMGGDFTYHDMLRLNLVKDYIPKIVDDLPDQYVLELKGKDLGITYAALRLWVRKGDFQPIRLEFYSLDDKLMKSIFYQDYRDFGGGFIRPGMLEVKSSVLAKQKTFLEIIYLKRGVKNPPSKFIKSNLGS